jgi:hypothetical protein
MSFPSPWRHPVCCYKRSLKEEEGLLPFAALAFWNFTLGFFGMGHFWKGKELWKGKIAEGKMLKRG